MRFLFDKHDTVRELGEALCAMHHEASHANRLIETVGEPPAAIPALAAVAIFGQVKVNIDRREHRVVESQK